MGAMKRGGIRLHMIDLGGDVTGNGVSKLVFTILAAVAEAERDHTRERIPEVKADQRKGGRFLSGIAPFGNAKGETGERRCPSSRRRSGAFSGCAQGQLLAHNRRGDAGRWRPILACWGAERIGSTRLNLAPRRPYGLPLVSHWDSDPLLAG
jgi:hypothetical protein